MVVSTKQGCYSGFQAAWEKQADGNFYPFNAGDGTWQLDVDMLIFPVISPIAASAKNLSAVYQPSIYPNPGNGRATLKYQLPKASEVSVTLRDVTGREVQRLAEGLQGAGNKQVELSLSNLNSGLYFYSIETPEGIASGKLNVVR
ncbi:Por secretion system C-terminal sorting domain-containing protein [Catalinimonas alkaloidigena]|uniref:Por secretion system C-terminal sorting domain-containing protein n=2 Tax=Catalinimonas alkaloidigena TaxID=1075417 RepID=A0A1G9BTI0_9BACT|nr:Por secretion system C-terminal sorting domain-containing protein [Catalinimonas alkaloidigena]